MLTADEDSAHAGHSAEGDSCSVEQMVGFPFVLDCHVARLWLLFWQHLLQTSVQQIRVNGVDSVADVGVESPLTELGLRHEWLCVIDQFALPFILNAIVTILP